MRVSSHCPGRCSYLTSHTGAEEIVRLPVCRSNPRVVVLNNADLTVEKRSHAEFQFEEWYDAERNNDEANPGRNTDLLVLSPQTMAPSRDMPQPPISVPSTSPPAAPSPKFEEVHAEERIAKRRKTITEPEFTLVHRPRNAEQEATFSERDKSSDEEWVTVVHRPKQLLQPTSIVSEAHESYISAPDSAESHILDLVDIPLSPCPIAVNDDGAESDWSLI